MSGFKWIERPHGWHSGPYQIELVGPGIWVLSRGDPNLVSRAVVTPAEIEVTSGSLSALKLRAEQIERDRIKRRRVTLRLELLALVALTGIIASSLPTTLGSFVTLASIIVGSALAFSLIDVISSGQWESVAQYYQ